MAPDMDTEMININQETLFNKKVRFLHLIQQVELKLIYPWVKNWLNVCSK